MLEGQLAHLGTTCTQQQAAALLLAMVQQGAALLVQQLTEVTPGQLWQPRLSADALLVTWIVWRHCQRLGPRCALRQNMRMFPEGQCEVCMLHATSWPMLVAHIDMHEGDSILRLSTQSLHCCLPAVSCQCSAAGCDLTACTGTLTGTLTQRFQVQAVRWGPHCC